LIASAGGTKLVLQTKEIRCSQKCHELLSPWPSEDLVESRLVDEFDTDRAGFPDLSAGHLSL